MTKNAKLYKRNYEGEEEQFKHKKIKEEFYRSDRGREWLLLVGKCFADVLNKILRASPAD